MPADWQIAHWPSCSAHTFLSHCQEDRDALVVPVFEELCRRKLIPWLDYHHYPLGRDAFETLREELLRSRHVVYFITPAALRQGRGWMHVERAYAAQIQNQLRFGDEISRVELPLLFVPPNDAVFQRSSWRALIDKARQCPESPRMRGWRRFCPLLDGGRREWTHLQVGWAADTIEKFVLQEESWAREILVRFYQDKGFSDCFRHDENLCRRIFALSPPKLILP